jgi:hypothetical protein
MPVSDALTFLEGCAAAIGRASSTFQEGERALFEQY